MLNVNYRLSKNTSFATNPCKMTAKLPHWSLSVRILWILKGPKIHKFVRILKLSILKLIKFKLSHSLLPIPTRLLSSTQSTSTRTRMQVRVQVQVQVPRSQVQVQVQVPRSQVQVQVQVPRSQVQVPVTPDQVEPKYWSTNSGWWSLTH